jgi:hypothetical protein
MTLVDARRNCITDLFRVLMCVDGRLHYGKEVYAANKSLFQQNRYLTV